jgi:hypothetical protein
MMDNGRATADFPQENNSKPAPTTGEDGEVRACPTCGAKKPEENEYCSDGFHAPGETYWPVTDTMREKIARAMIDALDGDLDDVQAKACADAVLAKLEAGDTQP